ncbi:hypothetical protein HF521_003192 [Silurus meridionalis]|uniref:Uncharacterized protein n=1 Tax=Silurus meridionalis TaxID=175797 RepID=A0A8T0B251_SILME|nr:hypothetical protein HF521_003192 [Silurus meridionalis]
MEQPLRIIIIIICYMFCGMTSSTGDDSINPSMTSPFQGNSEQTKNDSNSNPPVWSTKMYVSIAVPITLLLLAVIIITVLFFICRHKRGRNIIQQESVHYGNSEVFRTAENNRYNLPEKGKDNSKPKPTKVEPIYINVQDARKVLTNRPVKPGECDVDRGRTENIYCNVGCDTQQ